MKGQKAALLESIERAPAETGVYLFQNESGGILYVGKAKNIKSRLRSYLRPGGDGRLRIQFLERQAVRVEVIVTRTEGEALLLEDTLIKKHLPPFNVRLKDDKSFLMLRLDPRAAFPRFEPIRSRGKREPGFQYFGPYPSTQALRRTLSLLQSLVPLRDCTDQVMGHRSRPCLKHSIGRCAAPCVGSIGKEDYAALVDRATAILHGKTEEVERDLEKKMKEAAAKLQFERAQSYRDQIRALRETTAKRRVVTAAEVERDAIGYSAGKDKAAVVVLRYRGGNLVDSRTQLVPRQLPVEEILSSFLPRFYSEEENIPEEILIPAPANEAEMIEAWLREKRKRPVSIRVPQRGEKHQQLDLAQENARHAVLRAERLAEQDAGALETLRERLGLTRLPEIMDCFDISEMQGSAIVASRVRFVGGRPEKKGYRHYRVESVSTQDDFASMREVVTRSLRRGVEQDDLPDLIVIDGGKGQLSAALEAREETGAWDVEIVALAKDREKERAGEKFRTGERVFLPKAEDPIPLPAGSPELHLMERIRDEAHRFAITFHRKKREKIRSELDEIPGLGSERKKRLLRQFGSVQGIREAGEEALIRAAGIPRPLAKRIVQHLGVSAVRSERDLT